MSGKDQFLVRAIDVGRWWVYGPFERKYAEPFRDALEESGAFDRAELMPVGSICTTCGWGSAEGHDKTVHRELDHAEVVSPKSS